MPDGVAGGSAAGDHVLWRRGVLALGSAVQSATSDARGKRRSTTSAGSFRNGDPSVSRMLGSAAHPGAHLNGWVRRSRLPPPTLKLTRRRQPGHDSSVTSGRDGSAAGRVRLTYREMARATGKTAWCAVLPVMVVMVPAALLAQAPGRPRTNNLAEYELRCKNARVPLVDLWKSCQFGAAQDPDMPLTEAELGRIRRGTGGGSPTSCQVVPVSSANPTSLEPALGASAVKDQPAEFSLLLRAAIFSSIPPEAQRGCLTPGAAAFKKLIARRRSDLFPLR